MTDNISEEINVNTSLNSCLYLHADLLSTNSKLLLDTGSPYSILSTKMYLKLQSVICLNRTNNDVKLKAAIGSYIETCGKTDITFESDGHKFHQEFIIANIHALMVFSPPYHHIQRCESLTECKRFQGELYWNTTRSILLVPFDCLLCIYGSEYRSLGKFYLA